MAGTPRNITGQWRPTRSRPPTGGPNPQPWLEAIRGAGAPAPGRAPLPTARPPPASAISPRPRYLWSRTNGYEKNVAARHAQPNRIRGRRPRWAEACPPRYPANMLTTAAIRNAKPTSRDVAPSLVIAQIPTNTQPAE